MQTMLNYFLVQLKFIPNYYVVFCFNTCRQARKGTYGI